MKQSSSEERMMKIERISQMDQDEKALSRFLILYKLVEEKPDTDPTFHMQVYPGSGDNTSFKLLHEKQFQKIDAFQFLWNKPLLSIAVGDGDILFIRTTNNDYVTAGGIWQVKWTDDENGYVLGEVSSSGIEMVEVEELLSDEELALFEDALFQAKKFIESKDGVSNPLFVNGREVGAFAPEKTHQTAPIPHNVRAIEHIWHIVIRGYSPTPTYYLLEVVYHLQGEEWQYDVKILEERDASLRSYQSRDDTES